MQINFSIDNFSVEGNSFFNKCKRKQEIELEFFLHHVEKDTDTPIHYTYYLYKKELKIVGK